LYLQRQFSAGIYFYSQGADNAGTTPSNFLDTQTHK
jgi:hypothetical protein